MSVSTVVPGVASYSPSPAVLRLGFDQLFFKSLAALLQDVILKCRTQGKGQISGFDAVQRVWTNLNPVGNKEGAKYPLKLSTELEIAAKHVLRGLTNRFRRLNPSSCEWRYFHPTAREVQRDQYLRTVIEDMLPGMLEAYEVPRTLDPPTGGRTHRRTVNAARREAEDDGEDDSVVE